MRRIARLSAVFALFLVVMLGGCTTTLRDIPTGVFSPSAGVSGTLQAPYFIFADEASVRAALEESGQAWRPGLAEALIQALPQFQRSPATFRATVAEARGAVLLRYLSIAYATENDLISRDESSLYTESLWAAANRLRDRKDNNTVVDVQVFASHVSGC